MAQKVKPIPEGQRAITPHLVVQGAAQAIEFYKKAFGAKEINRAPGPDGKTLMHAELQIGDSKLYLADEFPGMTSSPKKLGGSPVVISLYVENVDAVYERAVAAGAKATMPLMNQFWGDRYGQLTDPFGHHWGLAQHIEDVAPQELAKRAEEFNKQWAQKKK